jgi:hypothetical protein
MEEHLDRRLAELREWVESKFRAQTWQIVSFLIVATLINHYWK